MKNCFQVRHAEKSKRENITSNTVADLGNLLKWLNAREAADPAVAEQEKPNGAKFDFCARIKRVTQKTLISCESVRVVKSATDYRASPFRRPTLMQIIPHISQTIFL